METSDDPSSHHMQHKETRALPPPPLSIVDIENMMSPARNNRDISVGEWHRISYPKEARENGGKVVRGSPNKGC